MGSPMPTRPNALRVLVVADAYEPGRVSEPEAGWGLVYAASRFAHTHAAELFR